MAIGGLTVEGISPGKFREMTKNQIMSKIVDKAGYRSSKRSIRRQRETFSGGKLAESEDFSHLKKDSYYSTIEIMKKTGTGVYKKKIIEG